MALPQGAPTAAAGEPGAAVAIHCPQAPCAHRSECGAITLKRYTDNFTKEWIGGVTVECTVLCRRSIYLQFCGLYVLPEPNNVCVCLCLPMSVFQLVYISVHVCSRVLINNGWYRTFFTRKVWCIADVLSVCVYVSLFVCVHVSVHTYLSVSLFEPVYSVSSFVCVLVSVHASLSVSL